MGLTLNERWFVIQRLPDPVDRTTNTFSVGYLVQDSSGTTAFCKALDYSSAFEADDPAEELQRLASAYLFERDLLEACGKKRMSHIVKALDSGRVRVVGASQAVVNFLIFELADADSRDILEFADRDDCLTALTLAHDCAVGLAQLHRSNITHQDVKPANVLGWQDSDAKWSGKLGDLGRAFCEDMDSPHANLSCPGDTNWAPPELLYNLSSIRLRTLAERQLADVYGLGSLLCYFLTGIPYTGILAMNLAKQHHWACWQGGYEEAKAYLADAHERALKRLADALDVEVSAYVTPLIDDMCNPDWQLRGQQVGRSPHTLNMLERYIARLNLTQHRVRVSRGRLDDR
jgi:eukaryotic-like serine/threonine-protein kinase